VEIIQQRKLSDFSQRFRYNNSNNKKVSIIFTCLLVLSYAHTRAHVGYFFFTYIISSSSMNYNINSLQKLFGIIFSTRGRSVLIGYWQRWAWSSIRGGGW